MSVDSTDNPSVEQGQPLQTGVYCIRNMVNGKVYVGSASISLKHRWKEHQNALRAGRHYNRYLQAAWKKYCEDAFEFLVLEECSPDDCIAREQFWIDHYKSANCASGYNICPNAGSNRGTKPSKATKEKLRLANLGKKLSAEHRAKIGAGQIGRKNTPQTLKKMARSAKRRFLTHRHPWTGKKHTEETKAKMSVASKGRNLGGTISEETKAKIRASLRGRRTRVNTIEQLAKMAATKQARSRFTREIVAEIRRRYIPGHPQHGLSAMSREFQCSTCAIRKILTGETWNDARYLQAEQSPVLTSVAGT